MSHRTRDSPSIEHLKRLRPFVPDLLAILAVIVLFDLATVLGPPAATLQAVLGMVVLGFVPGYLLLTILEPTRLVDGLERSAGLASNRLVRDGYERIALSIGCSLLLVPIVALAFGETGLGYRVPIVLETINGLLVVGLVGAVYARLQVPEDRRYRMTVHRQSRARLARLVRQPSLRDGVRVLLVLSVLAAAITMAVALVAPGDGEQATALSVLTRSEDGAVVAGDYPESMSLDENQTLVLSVSNREGRQTSYTVVAELQQVSDGRVTVEEELARFEPTVDAGSTWRQPHEFTPTMSGSNLRLVYTLYQGDAPTDADRSSAYRSVYLWLNVTEGA